MIFKIVLLILGICVPAIIVVIDNYLEKWIALKHRKGQSVGKNIIIVHTGLALYGALFVVVAGAVIVFVSYNHKNDLLIMIMTMGFFIVMALAMLINARRIRRANNAYEQDRRVNKQ